METQTPDWAPYLANRFIEPLDGSDRLALKLMRAKVSDTLSEYYDAVRKEPDKEMIDPGILANIIAQKLRRDARGTAWEMELSNPLYKISLHQELVRSIKSILT